MEREAVAVPRIMKEAVLPLPATSRQKELLFDKRYGWVYEEWTDPVEVANIGGRGMFSFVPLTAATIDGTLHLANLAADAATKALLSHQSIYWPYQLKQTVPPQKSNKVETPDVPLERSVAPSVVRFPRRQTFEVPTLDEVVD